VGYSGEIHGDTTKPDGTPRKLVDVSKLHGLGFHARIPLKEGIQEVYRKFVREYI
jgi:GDP-L-fucose synthase